MTIESFDVRVIKFYDRNTPETIGKVRVQHWNKTARTRRAFKILGMCWAGATCAVILPIVHFVLVPGLFLGGIVAAILICGKKSVVLGGESICPSCGVPLQIVRGPDQWPLTDMCAICQSMVSIEKTFTSQL